MAKNESPPKTDKCQRKIWIFLYFVNYIVNSLQTDPRCVCRRYLIKILRLRRPKIHTRYIPRHREIISCSKLYVAFVCVNFHNVKILSCLKALVYLLICDVRPFISYLNWIELYFVSLCFIFTIFLIVLFCLEMLLPFMFWRWVSRYIIRLSLRLRVGGWIHIFKS